MQADPSVSQILHDIVEEEGRIDKHDNDTKCILPSLDLVQPQNLYLFIFIWVKALHVISIVNKC